MAKTTLRAIQARGMIPILDLADLKARATGTPPEYAPAEIAVQLHGGLSRKWISYYPDDDSWWVYHLIDDTEASYATAHELCNGTTIGEALERGAIYAETQEY